MEVASRRFLFHSLSFIPPATNSSSFSIFFQLLITFIHSLKTLTIDHGHFCLCPIPGPCEHPSNIWATSPINSSFPPKGKEEYSWPIHHQILLILIPKVLSKLFTSLYFPPTPCSTRSCPSPEQNYNLHTDVPHLFSFPSRVTV